MMVTGDDTGITLLMKATDVAGRTVCGKGFQDGGASRGSLSETSASEGLQTHPGDVRSEYISGDVRVRWWSPAGGVTSPAHHL